MLVTVANSALLIEDDPEDRNLVHAVLGRISTGDGDHHRWRIQDAPTLAEGLAAIRDDSFDVILLDLHLPDAVGLDALRRLLAAQSLAPVLILTSEENEAVGVDAVKEGAQDFLPKARLDAQQMQRAIDYAIERHRLRRELLLKTNEIEAGEERLRRIIASSADGVVILDAEGVVVFANPAAANLFERPRSALIGSRLELPGNNDVSELELPRSCARPLTAEMRMVPLEWQGAPARLATLRDITAHKETLRQLDETRLRQLTVRDQFLSHVSHELRTPLTVAQQWISLMRDEMLGPLTADQRRAVETVLRNCRHLEKLIEDLLEATRSDNGTLRIDPLRARFAPLAEEAIASARAAQRGDTITYCLDVPAHLPDLLADPGRVRQVLINLLNNAAKFTPAGGKVTVTAAIAPDTPGDMLISVSDTGCGIPAEELERIFDHLYQRDLGPEVSRRGLGLGLYICRQIVTRHGGRIWAESTPGHGSTFRFTMPIFSTRALLSRLPTPAADIDALCVLGVHARPSGHDSLRGYEAKYFDDARARVASCVMPDRDLLLPRLDCDEHGELMFVVAVADEAGAAVLADRIGRVLNSLRSDELSRLEFRVFTVPMAVGPRTGFPAGAWLDGAAAALDSAMEHLTQAAGRVRRES